MNEAEPPFSGATIEELLRQCRMTTDAIHDPIFVHDSTFRVVWANEAYLQIAGLTWPEVRDLPYWQSFPPGEGPLAHCQRALETGHEEEETLRLADGRVFRSRSFPLPGTQTDASYSVHIFEDRTGLWTTQDLRHLEQSNLGYILDRTPEAILVTDTDGTIVLANPAAAKLLGRPQDDLPGHAFGVPAGASDPQEIQLPGGVEGGSRFAEMRTRSITWADESAWLLSFHEITERKRRERKLLQSATVFEYATEGILITDPDERIVAINDAFTRITGYTAEDTVGNTPRLLKSGSHEPAFFESLWTTLTQEGWWQGEIWNRRKDGELFPEWITIGEVRDETDQLVNYVGVFSDITQTRQTEQELAFLNYHDPLTGLANRFLFQEHLEYALRTLDRQPRHVAVVALDLRGFGALNDTLGPAYGDEALRELGQRLAATVRAEDTVARPGGDEFWVLLEDLPATEQVDGVVHKLISTLGQPIEVGSEVVRPHADAGVAIGPEDSQDPATLLSAATTALHRARNQGEASIEYFQPTLGERAGHRFQLEEALKAAIEGNELRVWYQPQVDLASGQTRALEALVRWQHPQWGLVSPGTFIPLAEETGLIRPLGEWVLEQAVAQFCEWLPYTEGLKRICVNIAAAQLERGDLPGKVERVLARWQLPAACLELEITEEGLLTDLDEALQSLRALKEQGVRLAIDDFGTGYSSLAYLQSFDVDTLKIDRTFISGLPADEHHGSIVEAVLGIAQPLALSVLPEGIETKGQAEWLRKRGVTIGQGFLYAAPLPPADVTGHLASDQ